MPIRINVRPDVKVYREHYCDAKHRTYKAFAKCVWRRHEWITGEGEYALVSYCGVTTVTLWSDYSAAVRQKSVIDNSACGGDCSFGPQHEIILLDK